MWSEEEAVTSAGNTSVSLEVGGGCSGVKYTAGGETLGSQAACILPWESERVGLEPESFGKDPHLSKPQFPNL